MTTKPTQIEPERDLPFTVVDMNLSSPAETQFASRFDSKLIGQPEARQIALDVRARYRNPLRSKDYPLGVYYCVGKSRRGKSLLAQVLAWLFHGDKDALTRITAEDYLDDSQITDLTGATPKYLGYRAPVDLSKMPREQIAQVDGYSKVSTWNRVRVRLNSKEHIDVVVIEEFEKSGEDFFKFWMEIFDKARKTLGNGEEVDFSNTVFILTSNLGMDRVEREERAPMGFNSQARKLTHDQIVGIVNEEMRRRFRPEFRNRLDGVIVYRDLKPEEVRRIVDIEVEKILERVITQMPRGEDFTLEVDEAARDLILDKTSGEVAELKRVLETHLVTPLGRMLDRDNENRVRGGDLVKVTWDRSGTALTFLVARGCGDALAGSEHVKGVRETADTRSGLALQRHIGRARGRAQRGALKEYTLVLKGVDKDEFMNDAAAFIHDTKNVFEVRVKTTVINEEAPYSVSLLVSATEQQLELVKRLYPELEVKPAPQAA